MKHGAYDFLTKPVNLDQLDLVLKRALQARDMETENRDLRAQLDDKFGLEQHHRPVRPPCRRCSTWCSRWRPPGPPC